MFLKLVSTFLVLFVPLAAAAQLLPQVSEVVNYIVEEDTYPAHEVTFANGVKVFHVSCMANRQVISR